MKIKTSELTGKALDWAVGKCEHGDRVYVQLCDPARQFHADGFPHVVVKNPREDQEIWFLQYSHDWAQGGPIIEREKMDIHWANGCFAARIVNFGNLDQIPKTYFAKTQLVAAMRCFVKSKLGDEVEIPDELL
jgi:hypothetical protein